MFFFTSEVHVCTSMMRLTYSAVAVSHYVSYSITYYNVRIANYLNTVTHIHGIIGLTVNAIFISTHVAIYSSHTDHNIPASVDNAE